MTLASAMACAAPGERIIDVTIAGGKVQQRTLRVEKDDRVRLRVTSDRAGELHLHGYRLETKVVPGSVAELAFTAYATGRYPLEWHAHGGDGGSRAHHGPPLAAIEVRPR